ncbi:MAG TPA: DsbA family protein [Puia sp.]|jgi:2-polyprenyl-6-methoxyphenol hydroxylase-like FAD-dependent oxidoreductase|nr:DsbA family protein [Puia sp.]
MKYVIIGGGVAGLAVGAFLQRKGREVTVSEKQSGPAAQGHAFLLHDDAISILRELSLDHNRKMPGERISLFSLRRPDGSEIKCEELRSWTCMKRSDLLEYMESLLHPSALRCGRSFSHFIRQQGRVVAAVFTNGETEYGDVFIGCDGGKSKVREDLFGRLPPTTVLYKEIVGVTHNESLWQRYGHTFVKFQHDRYGLSFGMIPTGTNEFVWFIQYDPCRGDIRDNDPVSVRKFCLRTMNEFPAEVSGLLAGNDFNRTYVWNTRDFDLLPRFHKDNVVLVGDAAHQALPFSSTGTTNALVGAKTLSAALENSINLETAFRQYHSQRAPVVSEHIRMGRELRSAFLQPGRHQIQTPLALRNAASQPARARVGITPQKLLVKYFTDPICSTCWIIQPALKRMSLEYGPYLEIKYYMGGLLPSWDTCEGKIKSPTDAARLWKDVNETYQIPIDGDIWLEDPLSSSFPPSIAVKAAQLQDEQAAILYLRRIREKLFLEKKNIMRWKHLEAAAAEVGLNLLAFTKAYEGKARIAFQHDLQLARELGVRSFPHLIFSNAAGQTVRLKGHLYYEDLERAILELNPHAKRCLIDTRPVSLFSHFPTMLEEEFVLLSDLITEDARRLLQQLDERGYIQKMPTKKGALYKVLMQP